MVSAEISLRFMSLECVLILSKKHSLFKSPAKRCIKSKVKKINKKHMQAGQN